MTGNPVHPRALEREPSRHDGDGAIDLTVIVVSYNTRELLLECLRSVFAETSSIAFEVIVVDNASADGSVAAAAAHYPQARVIALAENVGFARANNLAAAEASGRYVVLLNPDTVVHDGGLVKLLRFAEEHPEAGACGGRTVFADGSLEPGSCWGRMTLWSTLCAALGLRALFHGSRIFDSEAMGAYKRDTVRAVDVITGCLFIMLLELWHELGGFDPRFFMYCEDADLSLRVMQAGYCCLICPDAEIVHHCGASEKVAEDKLVRLLTAKSLYFQKHWSRSAARLGIALLSLRPFVRTVAAGLAQLVSKKHRAVYETWRNVWRRRREWAQIRLEDLPRRYEEPARRILAEPMSRS